MKFIKKSNCRNCFLLKDADPLELAHASDIVVGFYSNLLLEAEALGKNVIRYFPGKQEADLLRHKEGLKKVQDKIIDEGKTVFYQRNSLFKRRGLSKASKQTVYNEEGIETGILFNSF